MRLARNVTPTASILRGLARYDPAGVSLKGALKTLAACGLAVVVAKEMRLDAARLWIFLATLCLMQTGFGGPFRQRAPVMAATTIVGGAAVFVTTIAGTHAWLFATLAFLFTFGALYAAVLGERCATVGRWIMVFVLIAGGSPGGLALAGERSLALLAGGAVSLAVSAVLWPASGGPDARLEVALAAEQVGAWWAAVRAGLANASRPRPERARAGKGAADAMEEIWRRLAGASSAPGETRQERALSAVVLGIARAYRQISVAARAVSAVDDGALFAAVFPELDDVGAAVSTAFDRLAAALDRKRPAGGPPDLGRREILTESTRARMERLQELRGDDPSQGAALLRVIEAAYAVHALAASMEEALAAAEELTRA